MFSLLPLLLICNTGIFYLTACSDKNPKEPIQTSQELVSKQKKAEKTTQSGKQPITDSKHSKTSTGQSEKNNDLQIKRYLEQAKKLEKYRSKAPVSADKKLQATLKIAQAYQALGDAYLVKQQPEDAQQFFTKALRNFQQLAKTGNAYKRHDFVLYKLGEVYKKTGDNEQAKSYFGQLLKQYPKSKYAKVATKNMP